MIASRSARPRYHSLVIFLFAFGVFSFALATRAQNASASPPVAPGCGPNGAKFDVATSSSKPERFSIKPDPGKALVYFLQDDHLFGSLPRPTTLLGVDGQWVGATHANSFFYFSVDPGEHHLCTRWQSFVGFGARSNAALHFTAEPGGIYYFRVKDIFIHDLPADVKLERLDNDEGQVVAANFSFSTSHPKK
jgi:Protein of unknown function (DUF2846)